MITYAFILLLYGILLVVVGLLANTADVSSSSSILTAVQTASGYLSSVPFPYFLVSLLGSLAFLVVFEAFYWAYKGVRWVYNKIPGIN